MLPVALVCALAATLVAAGVSPARLLHHPIVDEAVPFHQLESKFVITITSRSRAAHNRSATARVVFTPETPLEEVSPAGGGGSGVCCAPINTRRSHRCCTFQVLLRASLSVVLSAEGLPVPDELNSHNDAAAPEHTRWVITDPTAVATSSTLSRQEFEAIRTHCGDLTTFQRMVAETVVGARQKLAEEAVTFGSKAHLRLQYTQMGVVPGVPFVLLNTESVIGR